MKGDIAGGFKDIDRLTENTRRIVAPAHFETAGLAPLVRIILRLRRNTRVSLGQADRADIRIALWRDFGPSLLFKERDGVEEASRVPFFAVWVDCLAGFRASTGGASGALP